jgi:NADH-quinone oxidoreductase subunit C
MKPKDRRFSSGAAPAGAAQTPGGGGQDGPAQVRQAAGPLALEQTAARLRGVSSGLSVRTRYGNQLEVRLAAAEAARVLLALRDWGFVHLANIFCIDWIAEDELELVYNLWSYEAKIHCSLKCRIPRREPRMGSIHSLWPQAQVYEQEVHEFFGVVFDGNPDLGPLFLHNWLDAPPLRKDFDTEEYSRRAYGFADEEAP